MIQRILSRILGGVLVVGWGAAAIAGVTVYEDGDKRIEIGGRIQLQYTNLNLGESAAGIPDFDDVESGDRVFFRRLRPYIEGSVTKHWTGRIEVDFGESLDSDEVAVKDAYMRYVSGGLHVTVGNAKSVFSRDLNTSSAKLELIERGFTGDHNFGTPDRQLGVRVDGSAWEKKFAWAASVGGQNADPDARRVDFDSPVSNQKDWNEGALVAVRADFSPLGAVKFDAADFERGPSRFTVSVGAYRWDNDGDNNTYTTPGGTTTSSTKADLDSATGYEISAGYRGLGLSVDAEYQLISADTVDPTFSGGVYLDGATDLHKQHAAVGYMLVAGRLEASAGWDQIDADNYDEPWQRTTLGLNWYLNHHDLKLQLNWRAGDNVFGHRDVTDDTFSAQMQFVF